MAEACDATVTSYAYAGSCHIGFLAASLHIKAESTILLLFLVAPQPAN